HYLDLFTDWAIVFVPKLLLATLTVIVGFWVIKKINMLIKAAFDKANVSAEINSFLGSIADLVLKFVVILIAAGMVGFELSSLVAILAAAGFAIGLALQGFLGNFASGITIVFFKPYKVGDWVEISEKFGRVESIRIFNTTIITPGEKTLIIPNGQVTSGIITNYSTRGHIRLELQVSMPYKEDFPKVKKTIQEALRNVTKILQEPEPQIGIESYDSHNIIVGIRPFIHPDDYWDATFEAYAEIKKAFHARGIQVAYSEGIELGEIGE
ncbi:MAG: mechanosensitive ion channel family protein, partial [Bacteroidetes bacterium]